MFWNTSSCYVFLFVVHHTTHCCVTQVVLWSCTLQSNIIKKRINWVVIKCYQNHLFHCSHSGPLDPHNSWWFWPTAWPLSISLAPHRPLDQSAAGPRPSAVVVTLSAPAHTWHFSSQPASWFQFCYSCGLLLQGQCRSDSNTRTGRGGWGGESSWQVSWGQNLVGVCIRSSTLFSVALCFENGHCDAVNHLLKDRGHQRNFQSLDWWTHLPSSSKETSSSLAWKSIQETCRWVLSRMKCSGAPGWWAFECVWTTHLSSILHHSRVTSVEDMQTALQQFLHQIISTMLYQLHPDLVLLDLPDISKSTSWIELDRQQGHQPLDSGQCSALCSGCKDWRISVGIVRFPMQSILHNWNMSVFYSMYSKWLAVHGGVEQQTPSLDCHIRKV